METLGEEAAPVDGLVRCDIWGMCNVCERVFTPWRTEKVDLHVCSAPCYLQALLDYPELMPAR